MKRMTHVGALWAWVLLVGVLQPLKNVSAAPVIESLEWASVDAQCIVRAKVIDVNSISQDKPTTFGWVTIRLAVSETIKGPPQKELTVMDWRDFREGTLLWKSGDEFLVFLDRRDRHSDGSQLPGSDQWVVRKLGGFYQSELRSEAIQIKDDAMFSIWSLPAEVGGDEMIRKVKQTVQWAVHAGLVQTCIVQPIPGTTWNYPGRSYIAPLGEPFSARARAFLSNHDPNAKRAAVRYLAHSNTPENQAAMRNLLSDPDGDVVYDSTYTPWQYGRFPIREEAYDALRKWGAAPDRPVVNDPADWHEPAGRTLVGVAAIAFAWPIGWLFARRQNKRRFSFGGMLATWGIIIACALAIVWRSSIANAWSLAWQRGGERWQLVSFDGDISLSRVSPSDAQLSSLPVGLVGAILQPDSSNINRWNIRAAPLAPDAWTHAGISVGSRVGFPNQPSPLWVAIAPWWTIFVIVSLPTFFLVARSVRHWDQRRTRRRKNQCQDCGYDLRASPTRCPECGLATSPAQSP